MEIEEREYIEPESINEEIINAINTVKEYCKAHEEYEKFRLKQLEEPTEVETHFIEAEQELKQIESAKKKGRKKS